MATAMAPIATRRAQTAITNAPPATPAPLLRLGRALGAGGRGAALAAAGVGVAAAGVGVAAAGVGVAAAGAGAAGAAGAAGTVGVDPVVVAASLDGSGAL